MLDTTDIKWRDTTVVLMDGAKPHVSEETKAHIHRLRMPAIFTGPYR